MQRERYNAKDRCEGNLLITGRCFLSTTKTRKGAHLEKKAAKKIFPYLEKVNMYREEILRHILPGPFLNGTQLILKQVQRRIPCVKFYKVICALA